MQDIIQKVTYCCLLNLCLSVSVMISALLRVMRLRQSLRVVPMTHCNGGETPRSLRTACKSVHLLNSSACIVHSLTGFSGHISSASTMFICAVGWWKRVRLVKSIGKRGNFVWPYVCREGDSRRVLLT